MGMATLVIFGGGGVGSIVVLQDRDLLPVLIGDQEWWWSIAMGVAAGAFAGSAAWWLVSTPFMRTVMDRYVDRIGPLMVRPMDRWYIALCAGVGEEIFFRGAIQYWLGLWSTAILFVAIHGYLDPRRWRLCIYGVALTLLMVGFGVWAQHAGLLGPMAAHTVLDVILLDGLHRAWRDRARATPGHACG